MRVQGQVLVSIPMPWKLRTAPLKGAWIRISELEASVNTSKQEHLHQSKKQRRRVSVRILSWACGPLARRFKVWGLSKN